MKCVSTNIVIVIVCVKPKIPFPVIFYLRKIQDGKRREINKNSIYVVKKQKENKIAKELKFTGRQETAAFIGVETQQNNNRKAVISFTLH